MAALQSSIIPRALRTATSSASQAGPDPRGTTLTSPLTVYSHPNTTVFAELNGEDKGRLSFDSTREIRFLSACCSCSRWWTLKQLSFLHSRRGSRSRRLHPTAINSFPLVLATFIATVRSHNYLFLLLHPCVRPPEADRHVSASIAAIFRCFHTITCHEPESLVRVVKHRLSH